jgi:hypothetical protein
MSIMRVAAALQFYTDRVMSFHLIKMHAGGVITIFAIDVWEKFLRRKWQQLKLNGVNILPDSPFSPLSHLRLKNF